MRLAIAATLIAVVVFLVEVALDRRAVRKTRSAISEELAGVRSDGPANAVLVQRLRVLGSTPVERNVGQRGIPKLIARRNVFPTLVTRAEDADLPTAALRDVDAAIEGLHGLGVELNEGRSDGLPASLVLEEYELRISLLTVALDKALNDYGGGNAAPRFPA